MTSPIIGYSQSFSLFDSHPSPWEDQLHIIIHWRTPPVCDIADIGLLINHGMNLLNPLIPNCYFRDVALSYD